MKKGDIEGESRERSGRREGESVKRVRAETRESGRRGEVDSERRQARVRKERGREQNEKKKGEID